MEDAATSHGPVHQDGPPHPEDVYIHHTALLESVQVGAGSRIWAFAHVMKGAVIGRDCNIGDHCYIEGGVIIGDDVVVKNGVAIWEGVTIEARVFVGPNVVFTNDLLPRAKVFRQGYDPTIVREGASVGANATIVCGNTVGRYAMIGAGAVVTKDVPDFALVLGNPAQVKGYVCRCAQRLAFSEDGAVCICGRRYRMSGLRVEEETP